MIIVGAITRLSGSGLSMVEWRPLIGMIPPLHEEEWIRVFDLYKTSPEFIKKNYWMTVSDFKLIFFWEWFHRLLGRLIGIFFALPFLLFLAKGWIPKGYKLPLLFALLLGGAQGLMGWYMVKSGLVDHPEVSHYRLAIHLMLALLIYSYLFWIGLSFYKKAKGRHLEKNPDVKLYNHGLITAALLTLTIFWGAYTAGLDAGLVYNDTFPKMGATWIPEEIWFYKPLWLNFFENHAGVQFVHRWLAILTACTALGFVFHAMHKKYTSFCFALLGVLIILQFGLGILTLFSGVFLAIAVMHQAGAVAVLTTVILCLHKLKYKN